MAKADKSEKTYSTGSSNGYGIYGTFSPSKSLNQLQLYPYAEKVKETVGIFQNVPALAQPEARRKAGSKCLEDNMKAFIELYNDVYKVDLEAKINPKKIEKNIQELLKRFDSESTPDKKYAFEFAFAKKTIEQNITKITAKVEEQYNNNTTLTISEWLSA